MNGETLYVATDYYRPFPDPCEVFSNRIKEHSKYLLPVGTLSLNHLSRKWEGNIHIPIPIEPIGGHGVLGEQSVAFHNHLCRPNWIGYHASNNKIELACDFRFFHKAYYADCSPTDDIRKLEAEELTLHYSNTCRRFMSGARHFQKHGWLCADPDKWNKSPSHTDNFMRVPLIRDLGGISYDNCSWSNMENYPLSRYPDQYEEHGTIYNCDRVLPRTEDGRDFSYVGEIELWNYTDCANGVLVLFYDAQQKILLTTFDWS